MLLPIVAGFVAGIAIAAVIGKVRSRRRGGRGSG